MEYGKLAYLKTENLNQRLCALEGIVSGDTILFPNSLAENAQEYSADLHLPSTAYVTLRFRASATEEGTLNFLCDGVSVLQKHCEKQIDETVRVLLPFGERTIKIQLSFETASTVQLQNVALFCFGRGTFRHCAVTRFGYYEGKEPHYLAERGTVEDYVERNGVLFRKGSSPNMHTQCYLSGETELPVYVTLQQGQAQCTCGLQTFVLSEAAFLATASFSNEKKVICCGKAASAEVTVLDVSSGQKQTASVAVSAKSAVVACGGSRILAAFATQSGSLLVLWNYDETLALQKRRSVDFVVQDVAFVNGAWQFLYGKNATKVTSADLETFSAEQTVRKSLAKQTPAGLLAESGRVWLGK